MKTWRWLLILALIAPILIAAAPSQAGGMWYAWAYFPETDTFLRIWEDGSAEEHALDLPPGWRMTSHPRAWAPNGDWLAFCGFEDTTSALRVYVNNFNPDAAAKAGLNFPMVVDLGSGMECAVTAHAFSVTDSNLLAVGVMNTSAVDPEAPADPTTVLWRLLALDVTTGSIVASLDSTSPQLAPFMPEDGRWFRMPFVYHFAENRIIFEPIPWFTEFSGGANVIAWDFAAQTVTANDDARANLTTIEHAATGDVVWLAEDESRPVAQVDGLGPRYNVVMYQRPGDAAPRVIFHQPDALIAEAVFVAGGEMLALRLLPAMDQPSWALLARDGTVTAIPDSQNAHALVGLRDGYALWRADFDRWNASFTRYTLTGDATPLWEADNPNWSLVWSLPQDTGGEFVSFAALP